jgi:hypothetical protein
MERHALTAPLHASRTRISGDQGPAPYEQDPQGVGRCGRVGQQRVRGDAIIPSTECGCRASPGGLCGSRPHQWGHPRGMATAIDPRRRTARVAVQRVAQPLRPKSYLSARTAGRGAMFARCSLRGSGKGPRVPAQGGTWVVLDADKAVPFNIRALTRGESSALPTDRSGVRIPLGAPSTPSETPADLGGRLT